MAKSNQILIISIVVSLMGLISSTKPSLSHSGHDHSKPQFEQEEKQSEAQNKINQEMETEVSNPSTRKSSISEELVKSSSATSSKQFNLRPQPTELIFFLLLASPYLLYTVKKKMYKRESN
jgi:hypothetical protein